MVLGQGHSGPLFHMTFHTLSAVQGFCASLVDPGGAGIAHIASLLELIGEELGIVGESTAQPANRL